VNDDAVVEGVEAILIGEREAKTNDEVSGPWSHRRLCETLEHHQSSPIGEHTLQPLFHH
jgi:hypothetical protein